MNWISEKINNNLAKVFLIALLGFLSIQNAAAANVGKIIAKIQKKYQQARTVSLTFTEVNHFSLTKTTTEAKGHLIFKGQEKFRLETDDQVLVSDSKTFWRFNKIENQVLIDKAKKSDQDVLLNQFLHNINDHYFSQLLKETKTRKGKIYEIKLTPKPDEQSPFTAIKIWVRDKSWEIFKVIYVDYNDNETEYIIDNMKLNLPVKDSEFTFAIPESTEVVDLRF